MKRFSTRTRSLLLALATVACTAALLPSGAAAEAVYTYEVSHDRQNDYSYLSVYRLDTTKNSTFRVMRGAVVQARSDNSAGYSSTGMYLGSGIEPGDVVEVYQPQTANPVPDSVPTETWTVPTLTATVTAGQPTVTGTSGAASLVRVRNSPACDEGGEQAVFASLSGGLYSAALPIAPAASDYYSVMAVEPDNDSVRINDRVPGDAYCVEIDAAVQTYGPIPDAFPFEVDVWGLDQSIPTTRLVLRRSGSIIADENSTDLDLTAAQKPLPGDVIEVYRPAAAPTPAFTMAIPNVVSTFDPGNDLVAVDAPAAKYVDAQACTVFDCAKWSERVSSAVPAGRTLFSFVQPFGWSPPFDLQPDSQVESEWVSADSHIYYEVTASVGDLTSPVGKISLAKKLKLKKIGKRIKFKLNSNEAGTLKAKLTTATPKRRGKSKKQVTLASSKTLAAKAGSNTVNLTVSKTGKKSIKKLVSYKKSQTATLSITLTDAAGNVTTVVKSTKLALK